MKTKKRALLLTVLLAVAVFAAAACSGGTEPAAQSEPAAATTEQAPAPAAEEPEQAPAEAKDHFVIGLSNATMNHPWRIAMVEQNVAWAEENWPEAEVIVTDGDNNATKQVADMEDLIAREVDLILLSPLTEDGLAAVAKKAMDAGIPVVTIDRHVDTEVTAHIGADNKALAGADAQYLADLLDGKARIIEIGGTSGASAEIERHGGFVEVMEQYPEMEIIETQDCDFIREPAMTYMEQILQKYQPGDFDAIFAQNDEMAWGAVLALEAQGREGEVPIVSIDGQNDMIELIDQGIVAQTAYYSTCAPDAMQLAQKILTGQPYDELVIPDSAVINADNVKEWIGKGY